MLLCKTVFVHLLEDLKGQEDVVYFVSFFVPGRFLLALVRE
jgi:hypothetical protein